MTPFGFDLRDEQHVRNLIESGVGEGQVIEYKEIVPLGPPSERKEVLKDISGMGNGGGGVILYGIRESASDSGVPETIVPLTDPNVLTVLENIVRDGIRPSVLVEYERIDVAGGFVLALHVFRSSQGPYMVQGYGQHRYFTRIGSSTLPMNEQQVRDAYAIALRNHEDRERSWSEHFLPPTPPTTDPWLTFAALPTDPLVDVLDPGTTPSAELRLSDDFRLYRELGEFDLATTNLRIWAGGFYGTSESSKGVPDELVRLHRDGAVGLAHVVQHRIPMFSVARGVNAQILYATWLLDRLGIRQETEIRVRLENLEGATTVVGQWGEEKEVALPYGVPPQPVSLTDTVLPTELLQPSFRHRLGLRFADRLHNAFGLNQISALFRTGQLYDRHGDPAYLAVYNDGIFGQEGERLARAFASGAIRPSDRDDVVAYIFEGAVVDERGDALAALEMAPGSGLPRTFLVKRMLNDPRARGRPGPAPLIDDVPVSPPQPSKQWSEQTLNEVLE